jgi:four helix bundle protein
MRDHRDLEVWSRAIDLAAEVYKVTGKFPRTEAFGLTIQMRRAAVSIASNIAEGAARRTTKDFIGFIHVARGSLSELQTQFEIAERVGMAPNTDPLKRQVRSVGRLLNGLLRALRQKVAGGTHRI